MTLPTMPQNKNNLPVYTIIMAAVMLVVAVCALIFIPARNHDESTLLVGMIIASVPGLIASAFGERNHRDIRNGVVESKAKAGAIAAIQETGVQDVVDANGRGQGTNLAMQALSRLLEANTSIHLTHEQTPADAPTQGTAPPPAG